ncbi:serine/threonine protein kinase [Pseudogymnoascus verrucosus]|uniref:non-specific serine/threonine protein kinase n=1 Tax=Pseudogymnoascus verrucosus TaxID=342668 RepID=A0A1B8GX54_9PEZI|nr:serine/threonine protein kinase [Pseudogymnoascus verrucosus]OBU00415.2 serine/threonine protein kinase [Pseudogymnoascus verrucosus]
MSSGAQRSVPGSPAVRFASSSQEIEPVQLDETSTTSRTGEQLLDVSGSGGQLRDLSESLSGTHLQSRRMSHFNFEPVSLPASRVPSTESFQESSRHPSQSSASGRPSLHSRSGTMQTPPLTPAVSGSREATGKGANLQRVEAEIDPTTSVPQISPPTTQTSAYNSSRPGSSGQTSLTQPSVADSVTGYRKSAFAIGPSRQSSERSDYSQSVPQSREPSPSRGGYSRPFTPAGEPDDPYASNKRPPQSKNLDTIEPRFVFSGLNSRHRTSPSSSTTTLPRSCRSSADLRSDKKSFSSKKDPSIARLNDDALPARGSMSELKRFLKIGSHHKSKRNASPSSSIKSGIKTPTSQKSLQQLPFGEDHGLTSKYGKFGKVLGAGAGGSVRLMKRSSDGTTFAVKEFRARHAYETEKEYTKKVTAEFCIGSTLHHGNIIETLDIIREKGKWYEVMEYAPYDLFAIVMTGKMSREEVSCSFLQILSGVTFIHSMGLAHRDLKLDNVVVNEFGIMKIIDFGSASMFKYPFETEIVLASGIVGSDPYLAPEVYDERKYDPQPADIWSLAIIFCCMSLRRFPWKMPRMTDNSYRLFASPPSESTEPRPDATSKAKSETEIARIVAASQTLDGKAAKAVVEAPTTKPAAAAAADVPAAPPATGKSPAVVAVPVEKKPEVIKGPWRLLRLLPRETRHIIGRMLEIDPRKRATMAEVLEDPWIGGTVICRQDATTGHVISATGHTHTLEPPSAPAAPAK